MTSQIATAQNQPTVIETVQDLRNYVSAQRAQARKIALVPTMGALHEGHLELVKQAMSAADVVIVSIFVNPTQFGPNEDFDAYPRTWDEDLSKLASIGTHAIFHPSVNEMYKAERATTIHVTGVSEGLCGGDRPGHFDGVALIVTKLLLQALPDIALFGEKDWQQLQVIKRFATDLDIPTYIKGVPIVRDKNGLALSSRNKYLNEAQYNIAIKLNKVLFSISEAIASGTSISSAKEQGLKDLQNCGFDSIDYLEICDAQTLSPVTNKENKELRILTAVKLGKARLIDNVAA